MSIGERINSHLHIWHHHQTHWHSTREKRPRDIARRGGEEGGGSDEWSSLTPS